MRRPLRSILALTVPLLCAACRSAPQEELPAAPSPPQVTTTGADCVCGTPRGDLLGCHCEECLLNGGNPWNPACTCLPLRPVEELEITYAGYGAGGGRPRIGGNLVGLDEIKLDGQARTLRGEVLQDDGESIEFRAADASVTRYTYDQLDHRMVYRLLKAKCSKENAEDELKLAAYARDCGLYAHSRRHYANALALDAELAPEVDAGLAELRRRASESELEAARACYDGGDVDGAREHLVTLLNEFPEEPAAGSAGAMLGELSRRAMGGAQSAATAGLPPAVLNELAPIGAAYERAAQHNEQGLAARAAGGAAEGAYRAALRELSQARSALARLDAGAAAEPRLGDGARAYDGLLRGLEAEVHLNLASLHLADDDLSGALAECDAARAADPDCAREPELRARIEARRESERLAAAQAAEERRSSSSRGLYRYSYGEGVGLGIGGVGYGRWRAGAVGGMRRLR